MVSRLVVCVSPDLPTALPYHLLIINIFQMAPFVSSDFSNFVDGTVIAHTIQDIRTRRTFELTGYITSVSSDEEDVLLVVDDLGAVFDSLLDFVRAHYRFRGILMPGRINVWNACKFQKSGRWYPCSEMKKRHIQSPPPAPAIPDIETVSEYDADFESDAETATIVQDPEPEPEVPPAPRKAVERRAYIDTIDDSNIRIIINQYTENMKNVETDVGPDGCTCLLCESDAIPLEDPLEDGNTKSFDMSCPYTSIHIHRYNMFHTHTIHIYWSTDLQEFRVYEFNLENNKYTDTPFRQNYIDTLFDVLVSDKEVECLDIAIPCFPSVTVASSALTDERRKIVKRALQYYTSIQWEIDEAM